MSESKDDENAGIQWIRDLASSGDATVAVALGMLHVGCPSCGFDMRNLLLSIEDLELSTRSYNGLKRADLELVIDIVIRPKLGHIQNMGAMCHREIEEALAKRGLRFGMMFSPQFVDRVREEAGRRRTQQLGEKSRW